MKVIKLVLRNNYLRAFLKFITACAVVHVVVLVISFCIYNDSKYLNIFYILGLGNFFPSLVESAKGKILSAATILTAYLYFLRKHEKVKAKD